MASILTKKRTHTLRVRKNDDDERGRQVKPISRMGTIKRRRKRLLLLIGINLKTRYAYVS